MILSAYGIVFQFALSIGIGANIRVGNLLGADDARGARKAAWCGVRLAFVAAVTAALGLGFGRGQWPRLYDVSEEVLDTIIDLTPIYVVAQVRAVVLVSCCRYCIVRGPLCLHHPMRVPADGCRGTHLRPKKKRLLLLSCYVCLKCEYVYVCITMRSKFEPNGLVSVHN